ncbi:RagB/SusD family nutrient uptake outer membrane protein [Ferruginibacter sp.]|nr:RagB/SusD family nutrient uptake outer membrane protein [Ferruginibacter sp.]
MKALHKIFFIAAIMALFMVVSCKKFIKEELVTTLTEDYYKTDNGLLDLVKSAYTPLKWKFEGEQSFSLWNYGLDEFAVGDQLNSAQFNSYGSELNSNGADGFLNNLWINYYAGINRCNLGIENISAYTNADATSALGTQAKRDQKIAELKFLRAYYYFTMVQQMGGVPVVTTASRELRSEFSRNTVAQVYEQVISDFRAAGLVLPWKQTAEFGRASKAAAYHFLAKVYLTRGSAVTDQRGQKPTDMDSAIVFADSVIRLSGHALEANYGSLFNASYATHSVPRAGTDGTPPVGSIANIIANNNSNEIIFSAQFSQITALSGLNNTVHLYFGSQYDAGMPGMARDLFNGRPFRRLRPTDYTIDVFDWANDSRFFKTFQTAFYRNVTSNSGLPLYTAANAPTPDVVGKPRIGIGDTASLFIVNKPDSASALLTSTIAGYRYYATFARYKKTSATATPTSDFTAAKYLHMIKWMDPVRIPGSTAGVNEAKGIRNGTLARLGETYLILAEAYGRKGDYTNALLNVNIVRSRAAYKSGETKNPSNYMFYGKPINDVTSTAPAMQATATLFNTNAPSELYPVSVTSTTDRFIHFMLNERTRELCGELIRWDDLARTETFYTRTKLFNTTATFVAPYHKLRPIPLPQIISQTKNGNTLTAAEIAAYQNPGY